MEHFIYIIRPTRVTMLNRNSDDSRRVIMSNL